MKDSKTFSLSGFQHLVKTLAGNHTVLSSFAKFQHPTAQLLVDTARNAFFQIEPVHSFADRDVIDYLKNQPGFQSIATTRIEVPFRLPTTVDYLAFVQDSAGPIFQILAPLDDGARAAAWADMAAQLDVYQTADGWVGPNT